MQHARRGSGPHKPYLKNCIDDTVYLRMKGKESVLKKISAYFSRVVFERTLTSFVSSVHPIGGVLFLERRLQAHIIVN